MNDITAYIDQIRLSDFDDDEQFVACILHLDHVDKMTSTLRLWVIARALVSRNGVNVINLLIEQCQYTIASARIIVDLAGRLGFDLINDAVERRAWRSLRQWAALGQSRSSPNHERAVRAVIEDDVPPIEIEAIAADISLEEAAKNRVVRNLISCVTRAAQLGMSEEEILGIVREVFHARSSNR